MKKYLPFLVFFPLGILLIARGLKADGQTGVIAGSQVTAHGHTSSGDGGVLNNPKIKNIRGNNTDGSVNIVGNAISTNAVVGDNAPENLLQFGSFENWGVSFSSTGILDGSSGTFVGGWSGSGSADSHWDVVADTTNFYQGAMGIQAQIYSPNNNHKSHLYYTIPNYQDFLGSTVTFSAWIKTQAIGSGNGNFLSSANIVTVGIYDGVTLTTGTVANSSATFTQSSATKLISNSATMIRLEVGQLLVQTGTNTFGYTMDGAMLNYGSKAGNFLPKTYNLVGTVAGDTAAAGFIGQVISTAQAVGTVTNSASNGVFVNTLSMTIPPGNYWLTGSVQGRLNGATATYMEVAISVNSGNTQTDHVGGVNDMVFAPPATFATGAIPFYDLKVTVPTVVYIKVAFGFSAGQPQYVFPSLFAIRRM